jgi:hypothetical protein
MRQSPISPDAPRSPANTPCATDHRAAGDECFARYGYGKTTVSDLAKEIGFSTPSIASLNPSRLLAAWATIVTGSTGGRGARRD